MNLKKIKDILKLNESFYQSISEEFSRSRQKPWKGWDRAVEKAFEALGSNDKKIKVLDLGCGNGRFYDFINNKNMNIEYVGIDTNNDFIKRRANKTKNASFVKGDVIQDLNNIKEKYNIIAAFGLTHHIPSQSLRFTWFNKLSNLLDKKGVLILTFWRFKDKPGDYFLRWKERKDIKRYCHQYSNKELDKVIKTYEEKGLKLIDKFISDKENLYLIFGNI
ncbi:class I SAM-dependent methyltransferase [candidate division WWE3 bacterium]|uniref:Class I SAM-dependent methyltransferase n=1 Tax=candidate division WWE3 bacterium TaxID=2053526 RepID=A0A7X9HSY7_UNCKA|nr:class I SAM-dependent methyltransferase [candidate division WWE3 bacterium]